MDNVLQVHTPAELKGQVSLEPEFLKPSVIKQQIDLIAEVQKAIMKEGKHYGIIQGTDKHTLYKAGVEVLGKAFRLIPTYSITTKDLGGDHREVEVITTLTHMVTGVVNGQGVGNCSTREPKYRYRNKALECPTCHKETVIKGKAEFGGGFVCWQKKGGCGQKFKDDDPKITNQKQGKIENTDPAEQWNTILKMAKKRSHSDAIHTATIASDMFLQDMNEDADPAGAARPEPVATPTKKDKPPIRRKASHPGQGKENFEFYLNVAKKQPGKIQEVVQGVIDGYCIDSQNPQKDWNDNDYADVAAGIKTILGKNGVNV